jgi:hypothetical protein
MKLALLTAAAIAVIGVVLFVLRSEDGSTAHEPTLATPGSSAAKAQPSSSSLARSIESAVDTGSHASVSSPSSSIATDSVHAESGGGASALDDAATHAASHLARATLDVHLVDAGGAPIAGARLRLLVDPDETIARRQRAFEGIDESEMQQWIGETDAQGRSVIRGLPAALLLRPWISRDAHKPPVERDALELASGEAKSVEWRMSDGYELSGRVLDQDDRAVSALDILLERPEPGLAPADQVFDENGVIARTHTDETGRFRLHAIPAGTWWLGPEPPGAPNHEKRNVAAIAIVIDVPPRTAQAEIVLRVERGLWIRGRVLDPSGASAGRQWVTAKREGTEAPIAVMSAPDGSFSAGPLLKGSYAVSAGGGSNARDEFLARSPPVVARAGDESVVLTLEIGGSIRGRVIDRRTGEGMQAQIWLSAQSASASSFVSSSTAPDSSFEFDHLNAGVYDIGARSAAGLCGIAKSITVERGARTDGIVLALDPSATLVVRYEGEAERASLAVKLDGVHIPGGGVLVRGASMSLAVPAGRSTLEVFLLGRGQMPDRAIDIGAGETREIVINDRE